MDKLNTEQLVEMIKDAYAAMHSECMGCPGCMGWIGCGSDKHDDGCLWLRFKAEYIE